MLTYQDGKFYIKGREASENSGRCMDCAQATIVVKGSGKEYRVGCVCTGGIDFGELKRGRIVRAS